MSADTDDLFYMAPWPTLCDDCGHAITKYVVEREDLEVFTTYCPHRFTLAILYVGQVEHLMDQVGLMPGYTCKAPEFYE